MPSFQPYPSVCLSQRESAVAFVPLSVISEGNLRLTRHPTRRRRFGQAALTLAALLYLPPAQTQQMPSVPGMSMPTPDAASDLLPLAKPTNLLAEVSTRPSLTLEDLLTKALAASPTLAQSRSLTNRTEALARQSALYPNPTVGYQGDQIRGGSFGGGEQGAFIAQIIPLGGKLTLRRKALEADAATTRTSTEVQQTRIRADVTQAFYAALAAQESARIRRDLLLVSQDATQTAHQLANIGQTDTPDLLTIEVEQEQAQLADEQAQRLYLAYFHILAILTGDPSLPPSPLQADLAATPTPNLTDLFDDSPVIRQAQSEITAAKARLASANREVAPDLQVKAGEQYNFEQLGSNPAAIAAGKSVGPQTFSSASITIPLWNRNQGNIAAAEADLASGRQNLRRLQLSLRAQAEPLLQTINNATIQATRYRTSILPRATRAATLYDEKYKQMAQAYPQVLAARRTLLNLQLQYTDTLATIWRTAIALQNSNLFGSLGPVDNTMQQPATVAAPID